jgi:hypothetical protein
MMFWVPVGKPAICIENAGMFRKWILTASRRSGSLDFSLNQFTTDIIRFHCSRIGAWIIFNRYLFQTFKYQPDGLMESDSFGAGIVLGFTLVLPTVIGCALADVTMCWRGFGTVFRGGKVIDRIEEGLC